MCRLLLIKLGSLHGVSTHGGASCEVEKLEKPNGYQTNGHQNVNFSKVKKKLSILIPIRFDTTLGAAKETPERLPKQTGTKMPS